jgi:hypothetical protein
MNPKRHRAFILELCSEDAYGSWELWAGKTKTVLEIIQITQIVSELIKEKKIITLENDKEVPFEVSRLENELKRSAVSDVDADNFYRFWATDSGKKEYEAWAKEYWTEERVAKEKEKWRARKTTKTGTV